MKNKTLPILITVFSFLSFLNIVSGQAPNLGIAANFVLFTSVGAVGNTGISQLTGNVGTNTGATTGFGNVNGVMHNNDAATAQCLTDLQSAWYQLDTTTPTALHIPVLGNGETLFAGVYSLAAAGSLVSVLNLDAQGNPNAVFIIKTGGAFTTAASSSVNLINGAVACNVFWKAEGAISMAASTIMKGTLIAHNGAIDLGAGCILEGRAFSTTGSATVYGTHAYIPAGCGTPILNGPVAPVLGTVQCFALFSAIGNVSNSGITTATGDVGTDSGTTTGYDPLLVTGMVHTGRDISTSQCAIDLLTVYNYLDTLPYDIELLYPAQFGNMLVLTPHTYRMNAATVFTDTLYLDAEGNADAVFVIQVTGALSTSTNSKVALMNGAQAKNVFWKVAGAVTIGNNSVFAGTIICNTGAITLNTGVLLNGRAVTGNGDIHTTAVTAVKPSGLNCSQILPVSSLSFTAVCDRQNVLLQWTTTETSNAYFTVERSAEGTNWQVAARVETTRNSSPFHVYSFREKLPGKTISYYRLKQTGLNGNNKYGDIITVKKCVDETTGIITPYPNPTVGKFELLFTGDRSQVYSIEIFSANGASVYKTNGFQSAFDLTGKATGVYYVQVHLYSTTITSKIILEK